MWKVIALVKVVGRLARLARIVELDDQVEACRRVFASDTRWTVVRGSDLEEGESQGLPVWSRHVGDPILKSNITRRVDFALFMVAALKNDGLVHEAPFDCRLPDALGARSCVGLRYECGGSRVKIAVGRSLLTYPRSRAASSAPRPERGRRLHSADRTSRSAR